MNQRTLFHVRARRLLFSVAAGAVVLASCSLGDSFQDVAVRTIEDDLAALLEMEFSDIECEEPTSESVGTEFDCTASTADGSTGEFVAEIIAENEVELASTNIFGPEDFEFIENDAPLVLARDAALTDLTVDCPDEGVVLTDGTATCEVTDGTDTNELLVVLDSAAGSLVYEIGEPIG